MNNNIIVLIFLITSSSSCSSVFCTARAQSPSPDTNNENSTTTRTTLPVLLIAFLFAFFVTGFWSIYIRYCFPQPYPHALPRPTRRGIDPRVLATCPVISYLKTKAVCRNGSLQCAVCLAEFQNGDELRVLPTCGHVFHTHCIDAWLAAHVTCPVCRAEVGEGIEGEARALHVFDESSVREVGDGKGVVKMLRSHSTGHSLEGSVVMTMKRSASYDVVLRSGEVGEGSCSKGRSSNSNSNVWWVLSMTPPFVSRASAVREEKEGRTVFEVV